MKFSPATLATVALAYGADTREQTAQQQQQTQQSMSGYEGSMTNHRQVIDTLNERLKNDGSHSNEETLVAFITGADSQIDNAIATVSNALAPFTFGISKAIGNVLLGPFVQSVTNGAEVFVANIIGNSEDQLDAEMIGQMTGDYSRLIELSKKNNIDTSKLENLNQQLSNTIPKSKRATDADLSGYQGAMTNAAQSHDTLTRRLQQSGGDPHANADRLVAFITGADSQIDNAIATVSNALAPFTFGMSKAIGNVLLGPFVQSVTNGAEVLLANMIGGGEDRLDAELVGRLTGNYSKLTALSTKNGINTSHLQSLNEQISRTVGN